jgi:hypothetical protein
MRGAIPPLPKYAFMACCSVKMKHKNNFTFTFTCIMSVDDSFIITRLFFAPCKLQVTSAVLSGYGSSCFCVVDVAI